MKSNAMKILVLSRILPNSSDMNRGIYVFRQSKALSSICSIDVVAPIAFWDRIKSSIGRCKKVNKIEYIDGLEIQHPIYFHIPGIFRNMNGFFMFLSLYFYHKNRHQNHKWDVILSHFAYPDGFFAVLLGKALGIPVFISCLGSDINSLANKISTKKMIKWALGESEKVFVVSNSLKNKIIEIGIRKEKVVVVNNGIEINKYFVRDKEDFKKYYKIPKGDKIILYVGRLSKEKGVDVLIKAFSFIKDLNIKLYIVGGGPQEKILLRQAERLGLMDRIKFLGHMHHSEIPNLMNVADLFVLPSRSEGYPNVLLEALACGIPVLATDVGGITEIINNENLGIIVAADDPIQMAQGIYSALSKEWDRELLVKRVQHQSWEWSAQKLFLAITEPSCIENSSRYMKASC